jgi:tetratricopeptide (TPR) repeat protein
MYVAGEKYARESLEIYRSLGDDKGIGDASWSLSQGIAASGNYAEAAAYGNDALATFRRMGDPFRIGWGLFMLAGLELRQGRLEVANDQLLESLHIFSEARDISGILFNLAAFVLIASERGDLERANRLGGAVETLRSSSGAGLIDEPPDFINFSIPKRPTDDPQAEAWWDQGGHMSPEEATAYALEGAAADK